MTTTLELFQSCPSSIVSISTRTPVKLNKTHQVNGSRTTNPHFGNITKEVVGMKVRIGERYQDIVNEKLAEEGKDASYLSNPRKWGERIGDSCLIQHKGNIYVEVIVEEVGEVGYWLNGDQSIEKGDIIGLPKSYQPKAETQNGLEDKVIVRTIKLCNIYEIELEPSNELTEELKISI